MNLHEEMFEEVQEDIERDVYELDVEEIFENLLIKVESLKDALGID